MFWLCTLLIAAILLACSCGFNLDTKHPIMYEDPGKGSGIRGSYFGFSVLLHSGSEPWIQIGAPRGNNLMLYPDVIEPGVVYRCPIAEPCNTVKLDADENNKEYGKGLLKYREQTKEAWIGGSMDIQEDEGNIVVCGHRWRNTYGAESVDYMVGVCYYSKIEQNITSAKGVHKLLPLLNKAEYVVLVKNQKYVVNYAVGQAGMSVHFPPNKSQKKPELLIGAPGVYLWKGTSIRYTGDQAMDLSLTKPKVASLTRFTKMQYFGYQVNSGEFFHNERYYVASSPQEANKKGSVYIYTNEDDLSNKKFKNLVGEQIGELFGGSLAVTDINGDGLDDLTVGAPLYTISHEEGRIYIFFANSQSTMFNKPQKIDGRNQGARFGTAVVALGDLDKDGFADIAVGAPYENDDVGAVYIYSGGAIGLTLTQKIMAQDISSSLRGFGISIARAADIDMNMYADVAVGAFKSGHVVLFRAHPVVYLQIKIETDIHQLHENETGFNISVCLSYNGKDAPHFLNVTREIIVDEKYQRASIAGATNIYKHSVIVPKKGSCENLKIDLKGAHLDQHILRPISIKVSQKLINDAENKTLLLIGRNVTQVQNTFKKDIPVVNEKQSTSNVQIDIPFATGCVNICISELQLNSSFRELMLGHFTIGSKSELELQINLSNTGEPAYMAGVNVTIPAPIGLAKGHMDCRESQLSHALQLNCHFGNPLRKGKPKHLTLQLDMSGVKVGTEYRLFNISAYTISEDKNSHQNSQQLRLNLTTDANISIIGKSEEDVYSYFKANKMQFRQIYEVQKVGLSPIEVAEVGFKIPVEWNESNSKRITFLELYSPKAYLNGQPLSCLSEDKDDVQDEESESESDEENREIRAKRDTSQGQNEAKGYQPPANRTLFLNCSTPNVRCSNINCTAGPFDSTTHSSAIISMTMIIRITALGPLMGTKDIIDLTTSGSVIIKEPVNLKSTSGKNSVLVSSIFIGNVQKVEVATWIIALAIIAGILLFMFLVIGLMKAGFFERKKKEELKALKAVDAMDEFTIGKIQTDEAEVQELDS